MKSSLIREKFLSYFQKKGHLIIPSSSLIPKNDSSVLFTSAGMQQFKFYYTQTLNPFKDNHPELGKPLNSRNVATCQKCFRTSDIDSVGDRSHLTFFEMLGNFSFGGYFKKEAIEMALDFIFNELKIEKERIFLTYFPGDLKRNLKRDEESLKILKSLFLNENQIRQGGVEDNFWGPTGITGPCGPTVEIYVDGLEIWNLVFNEYFFDGKGNYIPLKEKGVDTGAGLERLALVLQYPLDETKTIFETDLFLPLINIIEPYFQKEPEGLKAIRIIADHIKSIVFLISEGIRPSNIERGYVLRRLIRRISRLFKKYRLDQKVEEIIEGLIKKVIEIYQDIYPEIKNEGLIKEEIFNEIRKFESTLKRGLKIWQKIVDDKKKASNFNIDGKEAFDLYQSYGFPIELIKEMAQEINFTVDEEGFRKEYLAHQEISRQGQEKKFGGHGITEVVSEEDRKIVRLHTATHLILAALKKKINPNIEQKGSDINSSRLRFDFSLDRKLTSEELKEIEDLVNQKIKEGLEVDFYETSYEEAIKNGAWGSFKDKYPEKVRVYVIKDKNGNVFSHEICKGPHVKNTIEIGGIKIISHESISSNIKRIKATLI